MKDIFAIFFLSMKSNFQLGKFKIFMKLITKILNVTFNRKENKLNKRLSRMPVELTLEEKNLIIQIRESNLTMTSYERLVSTAMACKYIIERRIEGDFVECGVWRGGNAILAASIFRLHKYSCNVYLFDTFAGMTEPTDKDRVASTGISAVARFVSLKKSSHNDWCFSSLEEVKHNFSKFNLLKENIIFIKGDVLKTLSSGKNIPNKISILRLDTDWYESTKKELEVLYPRLSMGGVLLIDDYGFWSGSRDATDEYFVQHGNRPFLQFIDNTGRAAVKC